MFWGGGERSILPETEIMWLRALQVVFAVESVFHGEKDYCVLVSELSQEESQYCSAHLLLLSVLFRKQHYIEGSFTYCFAIRPS
jgi:hypothetical protein